MRDPASLGGTFMSLHAHVVGWGKYFPQRVLTNGELSEMVDTSDRVGLDGGVRSPMLVGLHGKTYRLLSRHPWQYDALRSSGRRVVILSWCVADV